MRIGFEGKVLTVQAGGTGRYAINLLRALLAAPSATASDIEFVILLVHRRHQNSCTDLPGAIANDF